MSLSDKRIGKTYDGKGMEQNYYPEEDVKAAIKELKEDISCDYDWQNNIMEIIDKIMGEDLI